MNINSEELIELIDDLYSEYINDEGLEPLEAVETIIHEIGNFLVRNRYNQAIAFSLFMLKINAEDYNKDEMKKARHLNELLKEFNIIYEKLTDEERAKHKALLNSYLGYPNQIEISEILKFRI